MFWTWLVKLIGGFIPIGTKPFPEWLGKILWVVGIMVIFNLVIGYFAPKPTTTISQGGTQIIYQDQRDTMGFGCNAWRMYLRTGLKQK